MIEARDLAIEMGTMRRGPGQFAGETGAASAARS